jgi:hypothetical protein
MALLPILSRSTKPQPRAAAAMRQLVRILGPKQWDLVARPKFGFARN